jgi:hypothetical protein
MPRNGVCELKGRSTALQIRGSDSIFVDCLFQGRSDSLSGSALACVIQHHASREHDHVVDLKLPHIFTRVALRAVMAVLERVS